MLQPKMSLNHLYNPLYMDFGKASLKTFRVQALQL